LKILHHNTSGNQYLKSKGMDVEQSAGFYAYNYYH